MTKQELQKELLEKVKPGTKPSQLKKLKRSKSAGDIPSALSLSPTTALTRSKSQEPFNDPKYPYTTLISQQEKLETLQKETQTKSTTIALLRKKVEELQRNLSDLQSKYDELEKRLTNTQTNPSQELDHLLELDRFLEARHQNLKD